jgi:hypothetical protein
LVLSVYFPGLQYFHFRAKMIVFFGKVSLDWLIQLLPEVCRVRNMEYVGYFSGKYRVPFA